VTEQVAVPENCFAENLRLHTRDRRRLINRVGLELGLLIFVPTAILTVSYWAPSFLGHPSEITLMTVLKITSIFFLGYHTFENTPEPIYRKIILWMLLTLLLLVAIIYRENCTSEIGLCQFPKNGLVFEILVVSSFLYMVVFLIFNIKIVRTKDDLGTKVFIDAFIYAVSIPSLVALASILIIYHLILGGNQELFLHGATTFLVLISSAASICVDHYGKMFLLERRPCIDPRAIMAAAGEIPAARMGDGGDDSLPSAKQSTKKDSASSTKNGRAKKGG
jgi:hypothetical protein